MGSGSIAIGAEGVAEHKTSRSWIQSITHLLDDGKQKKSIKALDGVRAIACFSVLLFHVNFSLGASHIWLPGVRGLQALVNAFAIYGQCGVVLFFVLSGFLLFLPYAKALLFDSAWPSLRLFYLRRIFRIVPAYYVALFLMVLLFNREYFQMSHWHDLWLFLTFRQDFPATYQTITGPFWTLAVEFQFYLLLPLIAWVMGLVVRRGKTGWRLAKLTFCLCVMIAWGLFSLYWGNYFWGAGKTFMPFIPGSLLNAVMPYLYGGSGKSLEVFAVGMFLCMLYIFLQYAPDAKRWSERLRAASVPFFLIGLAFFCFMTLWHFYTWYYNYTLHFFDPYRNLLVNGWAEWQGICYAISFGLCILALLTGPSWLKRPFEWAPLRWLGLISFSLYMWHDPLIEFFAATVLKPLHQSVHSALPLIGLLWLWVLVVIIPVSLASYLWLEKPGMRLGEKLQHKLIKPRQVANLSPQPDKPLLTTTEVALLSVYDTPTISMPAVYDTPTTPIPAVSSLSGQLDRKL